ncbi:hypothetical protein [Nostoc sp.]
MPSAIANNLVLVIVGAQQSCAAIAVVPRSRLASQRELIFMT